MLRWLLCGAMLLLSACAGGGPMAGAMDQAAEAEVARQPQNYQNGESRAFLVSRDGQPRGLLWGTLHIAYSGDTVLPAPIRQRFAEAADLTVETVLQPGNPRLQPLVAQVRAANTKADPAALSLLDPQSRAALNGIGLDGLDKLSLRGMTQAVNRRAVAAPPGSLPGTALVDQHLVGFAASVGKPVFSLEEPALVDATLDEPNGPDAAGELMLALRRFPDGTALNDWLGSTYGRGASARSYAGLVAWRATAADLARSDSARSASLARRNAAWRPRLERILGRPGFHFIAFGEAHLLGQDGVVALLRRRGWTVQPCPGDRCPG